MAVDKRVQDFSAGVALTDADIVPIVQLGTSAFAVRTTIGLIKASISTANWGDSVDRVNLAPTYVGQIGIQLDTNALYVGTGLSVGNWALTSSGVTSVFGRTGAVIAVSGDYNTLLVTENTNLYFTEARVRASLLTGYVSGAGVITATDSVLTAIQKLNGNTSALSGTALINNLGRVGDTILIGGTTASGSLDIRSTSGAGTTDYISFTTGSQVEKARILSNGFLGILTPTPLSALHINGNILAGNQVTDFSGGGYKHVFSDSISISRPGATLTTQIPIDLSLDGSNNGRISLKDSAGIQKVSWSAAISADANWVISETVSFFTSTPNSTSHLTVYGSDVTTGHVASFGNVGGGLFAGFDYIFSGKNQGGIALARNGATRPVGQFLCYDDGANQGMAISFLDSTSYTDKIRIDGRANANSFINNGGGLTIGAATINASSLLEITSTTKGLRFPNMTTAQKNAITGVAGLVIYDTDLAKLCIYTTAWETVTSV